MSLNAKLRINNPKKARKIDQEKDDGNIEYKLKICEFRTPNRMTRLTTQMKFRLYEGEGKAIYNIGYHDNGSPTGIDYHLLLKSLDNLFQISQSIENLSSEIKSINILKGENGYCANVFIQTIHCEEFPFNEDVVL